MTNQGSPRKVNRRLRNTLTRAHLLDVRMRTATSRRRRRQMILRWISSVLGRRYRCRRLLRIADFPGQVFFKNSECTLRRISFELDEILTREEALAATGLREGVNIFSVDLAKVEAALRAIPQIENVRIERSLPDQIDISISARRPVAWVAAEGEKGDPPRPKSPLG